MKKSTASWLLALVFALGCAEEPPGLVLATTTSVQDSGLLDELLPRFTEQTGVGVRAVAVGSGAALRMGREGNADVLLTHAPTAEQELLDQGVLASRVPIMENFFVIAGPGADPAGVGAAGSAVEALQRIHAEKAPWVSRGDDSGTHRKERALWREAKLDPDGGWPSFTRTGSGMGFSLQVAGERQAYLLSDYGTFLAFRGRTGLVSLSKREPALRNVYSVMRVNPERFAVRDADARQLEAFLIEPEIQRRIGEFGRERFGEPLFRPLNPKPADG